MPREILQVTNVRSGQDSITSEKWSICPMCGPNSHIFFMSVFYDKGPDMWTEIFASLPLEKWKSSPGSPQVHFPQAQSHKGEASAKEFLNDEALQLLHFLNLTSGCACKRWKDFNCFDSAPNLLSYWWNNGTAQHRGKSGYFRTLACAMLNTQLS